MKMKIYTVILAYSDDATMFMDSFEALTPEAAIEAAQAEASGDDADYYSDVIVIEGAHVSLPYRLRSTT